MSKYISNLSNKSYKYSYFRVFIPTDLQTRYGGKDDFRLSLRYVRKEDTQILCLKLKQITKQLIPVQRTYLFETGTNTGTILCHFTLP